MRHGRRHRGPRSLFVAIYVGFLAVAFISAAGAGALGNLLHDRDRLPPAWGAVAERLAAEMHDADDVAQLAAEMDLDLSLYSADKALIGSTLERPPTPLTRTPTHYGRRGGWGVVMPLDDGRWLAVGVHRQRQKRFLLMPFALLLLVAAGCWPIARRITRRLVRLQGAVEELGGGDLAVRVPVEGRDEIATLATAFNSSAARIEELLARQKRMLASASHELRSPLARIRMALALWEPDDPGFRDGAIADVDELDALVGDLLVAGRLDSASELRSEPTDLRALTEPLAERAGAEVAGGGTADVDPRLIRLVLRNLLDNAARYAGGADRIEVAATRIAVLDRGPGVDVALRERIFEPFYRPDGHDEGRDGGVGLGLALVREIAEHHGGTAVCEEREGGGAAFVVTLGA